MPRMSMSENEEDLQRQICIRNLCKSLAWMEMPSEEGGIAWVELYVWYTMHGGKFQCIDEEGDKLRNRNTLHNEMAVLRK